MQDVDAFVLLQRVLGDTSSPIVRWKLQALGRTLSNYGVLGKYTTHHWLGVPFAQWSGPGLKTPKGIIPLHERPEDGVSIFCEAILSRCGDELLQEDPRVLVEKLIASGVFPLERTDEIVQTLHDGLVHSLQHLAPLYEKIPKEQAEIRWNHSVAFELLQAVAKQPIPSSAYVGLLAWAHLASNYGYLQGVNTFNWSMTGVRSRAPLDGHVASESGEYMIRILDPMQGVSHFLESTYYPNKKIFEKKDIGALALAMIETNAFGVPLENNEDVWKQICVSLRMSMEEIASYLKFPMRWSIKTIHPSAKPRVVHAEAQENEPKEPKKKSWWPWILGGGAFLGGGVILWRYLFKKATEEESPRQPVTAQQLKTKANNKRTSREILRHELPQRSSDGFRSRLNFPDSIDIR
jgi:hypothetical protein